MKYFIDTEFIEGKQDKTFLGIKYGETKSTIDLISIGIVSEEIPYIYSPEPNKDGIVNNVLLTSYTQKEYHAISKDFNLKAAWKNEWVRENVLKQIHDELSVKEYYKFCKENPKVGIGLNEVKKKFVYKDLKRLINKYGKTNKQIAEEIKDFVLPVFNIDKDANTYWIALDKKELEFYGYYSDYDWVVFCQLFGSIMDLPKGFPMYCIDLKQTLDEKAWKTYCNNGTLNSETSLEERLKYLKGESNTNLIEPYKPKYPKQTNEHNALQDAKWNYELYKFLNTL